MDTEDILIERRGDHIVPVHVTGFVEDHPPLVAISLKERDDILGGHVRGIDLNPGIDDAHVHDPETDVGHVLGPEIEDIPKRDDLETGDNPIPIVNTRNPESEPHIPKIEDDPVPILKV